MELYVIFIKICSSVIYSAFRFLIYIDFHFVKFIIIVKQIVHFRLKFLV